MDRQSTALTKCFYCLGDDTILVCAQYNSLGMPRYDMGKYHGAVAHMDPCHKCKEYMKQGVILLTIDPSKSQSGWEHDGIPNPHRTGGFFVVRDEAVKRVFASDPKCVEFGLKHRWLFIEHDAAVKCGLFDAAQEKRQKVEDKTEEKSGENITGE